MIEEDKETEVGFEFGTLLEFAGAFIANFRNSSSCNHNKARHHSTNQV